MGEPGNDDPPVQINVPSERASLLRRRREMPNTHHATERTAPYKPFP